VARRILLLRPGVARQAETVAADRAAWIRAVVVARRRCRRRSRSRRCAETSPSHLGPSDARSHTTSTLRNGRIQTSEVTTLRRYTNLFIIVIIFLNLGRSSRGGGQKLILEIIALMVSHPSGSRQQSSRAAG